MMSWQQLTHKRDPFVLIGLAGVRSDENARACGWGLFFVYAKVFVAIGLLLQWQLAMLHSFSPSSRWSVNFAVWCFFIIEWVTISSLVSNIKRYLCQNWMLMLIILLGLSFVMRNAYGMGLFSGLRPFLAILLLMPSIRLLVRFFADGQLRTTLLAAGVIVVVFGLLVAGVDPSIQSASDGIWWAIATVSTVGYGDVVPTSPLGRLIGVGLIVMGLGVFVVITANFLALVLKREAKELKKEEREVETILKEVKHLSSSQDAVMKALDQLTQRLDILEKTVRKE